MFDLAYEIAEIVSTGDWRLTSFSVGNSLRSDLTCCSRWVNSHLSRMDAMGR